jgi:polyhydroxyalkanoate synthesis regulator phasin
MTPEEIQRTIEQMLAVQRELQETQLRQRDDIDRLIRLVDRLIGYSITNESDHLSLEERMTALERRVRRLEPEN